MSDQMRKILYYENILEFKEKTNTALHLSEVQNWQLCRICLGDADYRDFIDFRNMCVMGVDGSLANVEEMLAAITEVKHLPETLPQKICKLCLNKITSLYFFKMQINRATDVLDRLYSTLNGAMAAAAAAAVAAAEADADAEAETIKHTTIQKMQIDTTVNDTECSSSSSRNASTTNTKENIQAKLAADCENVLKLIVADDRRYVDDSAADVDSAMEFAELDNASPKYVEIDNITYEVEEEEEEILEDVLEAELNMEHEVCVKEEVAAPSVAAGVRGGGDVDVDVDVDAEQMSEDTQSTEYDTIETLRFEVLLDNDTDKDNKEPDIKLAAVGGKAAKEVPLSYSSAADGGRAHEGRKPKRSKIGVPLLESLHCELCSMKFEIQRDLVEHVQERHPNEKAFKCRFCGNMFGHVQSLTRHMQTHRQQPTKNQCKYCDKAFLRADDMKRHMRVHTGERPYVCQLCLRAFKQPSELKSHTLSHTKEKLYKCDICEHRFSSRNGLYLHVKAHKGLKNFVCQHCEKRFLTNGELKSHLKVHQPK